jgi:LPXTG-site transpeptidase (sortase) family protein
MGEDAEGSMTLSRILRRIRSWLMRPRTVRIVAPAAFLAGVALVVGGLLVLTSGGGGSGGGAPGVSEEQPDGVTAQPGTGFRVPPRSVQGTGHRVPARQVSAGFRLVIDAINVNAPVMQLGVDASDAPQVPESAAKVAWYDFSAKPGTGSNAVMAGHVRWAGDHGVFAKLDELEAGDLVRLIWLDRTESVYEVFANREVNASDPSSLQVMSATAEDTITLITCGGTFVVDNDDPLGGDFTHRFVVQARMLEPSVSAIVP